MPAAYDHNSATDLSFPQKLYSIVLQEPAVFKWNCGHDELADSFRIIDEDALVHRILQQHFRTNRFSSFTRNLNIYGFKKNRKGRVCRQLLPPRIQEGRPGSGDAPASVCAEDYKHGDRHQGRA